jgi:predicted DNA-binding transcriptional regulator YafY
VQKEGPGGSLDVEMPVANVDAFVSYVIGFGDTVEVTEPPEIRTRILEQVRMAVGNR